MAIESDSSQDSKPAGRSLKSSVRVGLLLGGIFLASILFVEQLFVLLAAVAAGAGAWELATATRAQGWRVPRAPITAGAVLIMPATYFGGATLQWLVALATVFAVVLWRALEVFSKSTSGATNIRPLLRDVAAAIWVVVYVPVMTSFAVLMMAEDSKNGHFWVLITVTTVAFIDSAGYLVGRKFGATKIAPGVSPKKSLEGLVASIIAGSLVAIVGSLLLEKPIWFALLFAGGMLLAAVFGDLAESLIKRDLGIKDMSSVLPGHGGVMDRLDSILPASLIAYLLVSLPI